LRGAGDRGESTGKAYTHSLRKENTRTHANTHARKHTHTHTDTHWYSLTISHASPHSAALAGFGEIERVEMSGGGRQVARQNYVQAPAHDASSAPAGDGRHGPPHAHVVFSKKSACAAALQCDAVIEAAGDASDGEDEGAHRSGAAEGVRSWVKQYRSREVAEDELQASVDAYMTYFDERTEAEKQARKNRVVDEDGFELVTYSRKRNMPDAPEPPKKKKKELVDFYRFQIREKKREELAALRNKFEADKRRVEAMCVRPPLHKPPRPASLPLLPSPALGGRHAGVRARALLRERQGNTAVTLSLALEC
jgi:hypothetical protein